MQEQFSVTPSMVINSEYQKDPLSSRPQGEILNHSSIRSLPLVEMTVKNESGCFTCS
jgi:hypothetical protein